MTDVEVVVRPPAIPSKWDVIPIHGSDVASYKRCRRYWDWTSPTRTNLRRKVEIYGINFALWYGTGIHYALEMYYDPLLKRDPVEAFKTWFEFQVEGGMVTEEWLDRVYDIHPQYAGEWIGDPGNADTIHKTWNIKGLKELLPLPVQEEFDTHYELGVGMLTFYKDWAERNDNFVTVAAESQYSIPLGFESIDRREDSPNYGNSLEVHARGKRDAVIYFPDFDKFGINDHKTAVRIDEAYFKKLEKDEQCSNYLWATIQEAEIYDLPWRGHMVDRVLYTALRKNFPKPPTVLESSGKLSLDRQKEGTTAELFQEAIVNNEFLEQWFRENEKAQQYYTYLCEVGDDQFIQRDLVTRNPAEHANTGAHLAMVAKEMLSESLAIYPSPTGEFRCLECAFRAPCIAADDGSDWIGMLEDGYEVNRDR